MLAAFFNINILKCFNLGVGYKALVCTVAINIIFNKSVGAGLFTLNGKFRKRTAGEACFCSVGNSDLAVKFSGFVICLKCSAVNIYGQLSVALLT